MPVLCLRPEFQSFMFWTFQLRTVSLSCFIFDGVAHQRLLSGLYILQASRLTSSA